MTRDQAKHWAATLAADTGATPEIVPPYHRMAGYRLRVGDVVLSKYSQAVSYWRKHRRSLTPLWAGRGMICLAPTTG